MTKNEYAQLVRQREAVVPNDLREQILECMRVKNMSIGQTKEYLGCELEVVSDVVYVYVNNITKESERLASQAIRRSNPQPEHKFFTDGEMRETFKEDLRELEEEQIRQVMDFLETLLETAK